QALGSHGVANGHGRGIVERATRRATFLSSPTRLGLRNTTRRRGRSLATSLQVALGVGTVLAFGAFSVTALAVTEDTLAQEASDLRVYHQNGLIDDKEARRLASLPGVAAIQPIVYSEADFGGDKRPVRGLPAETIYDPDLSAGRWFTDLEVTGAAPEGLIGGPHAAMTRTDPGD
ncbi:MAG: ABC transporter permease, partial [Actinomycetia bacterium]|nr:ABC transporter permease [Actinomycetes bacterium]